MGKVKGCRRPEFFTNPFALTVHVSLNNFKGILKCRKSLHVGKR